MNFRMKSHEVGTYLELPCKEEKIAEFCKSVGIPNISGTEVTVDSVYLNDRANALFRGKTFNLDKLNYLIKRLDSFNTKELTTFYAVAYGEKIENIDALINLTFNTHCASVVSDFNDLEAIGSEIYLTEKVAASLEELNRLDGKAYFKKVLADNPNPTVTPYGIVYRNKNEYTQVFDGKHFPQYEWESNMGAAIISKDGFDEYLYLPFEETELSKALERLGTTSIAECEINLESDVFNEQMKNIIGNDKGPTFEKINSINHFAKKVQTFGINETNFLNNLINELQPKTEQDLYALFDSAYEFELYYGVYSAEEYGRYMICESGHFAYDENLEKFIDFEKYGNYRLQNENGAFINSGYILYHGCNTELSEMLEKIGIKIEPKQTQVLNMRFL